MTTETKYDTSTATGLFRARAWPVVVGGWADLQTKRAAVRARRRSKGRCASFLLLSECLEETGGYFLSSEPSWRKQVWSFCNGITSDDDLMDDSLDDIFLQLQNDMRLNDEWCLWHRPYAAERQLLEWAMEHDLDGVARLIDEGLVCAWGDIFDSCTLPHQSFAGGEAQSLLAMAAKHVAAPAAVRLLLKCGADPNCEMVHLSFNGADLPTCGPGALAYNDVAFHWRGVGDTGKGRGDTGVKVEILTALAEAGGEMFNAYDAYRGIKGREALLDTCSALFDRECERNRAAAKQRFQTVVALVGILSFWRKEAAAPHSKAGKAAIARCVAGAAQPPQDQKRARDARRSDPESYLSSLPANQRKRLEDLVRAHPAQ